MGLTRASSGRLAGAALALLATCASAQAQPSLENAVKATYLYKLGAFVDWPGSAFGGPGAPVKLCVIGQDPFGALLEQAVSGQRIFDRPIVIERMTAASRQAGCNIAFVHESDAQATAEALGRLKGSPVLTVTDAAPEAAAEGIVNFVIRNNRVRFQIDAQAAAANGLGISSKLMSLALPPRGRG